MTRPSGYNTKQREAILHYIISRDNTHVTAAQIIRYFEKEALPIGKATIYRHLDKLTESGALRRYITDGLSGACYQYIGSDDDDAHLHLKCDRCGELVHLECDALGDLERHVLDEHAFHINATKTVLYGTCDDCLQKA
ncbi:MAG: transcriptional repressor [Clostridia bacterium]|nr:transcriptional repressor [Clostridia bacterium]